VLVGVWFVVAAGNVLISTGLVDRASCPLLGREPACCGALCAGVFVEDCSAGDVAMAPPGMRRDGRDKGRLRER
jgi:hypothetical protein